VPATEVVGSLQIERTNGPPLPALPVYGYTLRVESTATIGDPSGGGGAGRTVLQPLDVVLGVDAGAVELYRTLTTGENYPRAVLTRIDPETGTPVGTANLRIVFVSEVREALATGNPLRQRVELTYVALEVVDLAPGAYAGPSIGTLDVAGVVANLPVLATDFGVESPVTIGSPGGGAGAGRATADEFVVEAPGLASSASLYATLVNGNVAPTAAVVLEDESWSFVPTLVSRFELAASGAPGDVPTLTVGLLAVQIDRTAGGQSFCWDYARNRDC